jgi:transposase
MKILDDWRARQFAEHTVEPNSGPGLAISTMQNHWHKLTLFLRVPGAPLDNDSCERAFKKAILHRKNALFYRTLNGARVGDLCMSLIPTAEGHQTEPFPYLVALQRLVAAVAARSVRVDALEPSPGAGRRRILARGELIAARP